MTSGRRLCQTHNNQYEHVRAVATQKYEQERQTKRELQQQAELRRIEAAKRLASRFAEALDQQGKPELVTVTGWRYRRIGGATESVLYQGWLMTEWKRSGYRNKDQRFEYLEHNVLTTDGQWHRVSSGGDRRHFVDRHGTVDGRGRPRKGPIPEDPPQDHEWSEIWRTMKRMNDQYSLGLDL